jgi:uncharacterized transporter YbjL
MTEYEIADLAVSTQEIFFQQWELGLGMGDRAFDLVQQFGNLLFGYLIVAYFVGAQLTRVQSAILTALYLFWQVRLCLLLYGVGINGNILLGEMRKISPDFDPSVASVLAAITLLSCLALASLYFMWSIRHPKTV